MIPKVSVIVPCYNVEKYVSECLDSILNQTLRDIEIIILNDGSTDQTLEIIEKYGAKDSRVKILSHKNRGLGPTRNRGILEAKGEYLSFVDSDDYISNDMLEILYNKAIRENADIVQGETIIFYEDSGIDRKVRCNLENVIDIKLSENNREFFYKEYYFKRIYSHNAWDKIYKKEFVLEHNLEFGDNKKIFAEDNWMQLQALINSPKICFVHHICYHYRQQETSIMHQPKKNLVLRHGNMIKDYVELIKNNGNRVEEKKVCAILSIETLIMEALNEKIANGTKRLFMEELRKIKDNKVLLKSICNVIRKKAFNFEWNKKRRLFFKVIGYLYCMKFYNLAHKITWEVYKRIG